MKRNTIIGALVFAAFFMGAGAMWCARQMRQETGTTSLATFKAARYVWQRLTLCPDTNEIIGKNRYTMQPYTPDGKTPLTCHVFPETIDNRALCAPIYDQGHGNGNCAYYALSAYISAMRWKRTGKLLRMEPETIVRILQAQKTIGHGAFGKEKTKGKGFYCNGCVLALLGEAIGIEPYEEIACVDAWRKPYTENLLRRTVHCDGLALVRIHTPSNWFELKGTGACVIPPPTERDEYICDHLVIVCGWNENGYIIANTWGRDWGANGFGILPFDQLGMCVSEIFFTQKKER